MQSITAESGKKKTKYSTKAKEKEKVTDESSYRSCKKFL